MKKRILLLFIAMIGMATSVGWAQEETNKLTKEDDVTFKNKTGYTFVYANGNPVTVTEGNDNATTITVDGSQESVTIGKENTSKLYLFGGSKNGTVASSKITVTSGTIGSVFGGGYGDLTSSTHAEVTGTSTLLINGGSIHNIFGGGLYYSKVGSTDITISNVTTTNDSWVLCGGLESGKTLGSSSIYPTFENSTNTVGTGKLTITGGSFCYIAIGGADGTQGYVKEASATISNAQIVGLFGNGSNGASDKVSGIITKCTFRPISYDITSNEKTETVRLPVEVASINRGHVKDVALTFNNCTFPKQTDCYVGGTVKWKQYYNGSQVKVINPGTISYIFSECTNSPVLGLSDGLEEANVEVTGAKVKIAPFNNGVDAPITTFTLGAKNQWIFDNGLEKTDGVTFTNNGTLNIGVPDVASLTTAIKAGANKISLVSGSTYELTEPLFINKPVVLTTDGKAKATINGKLVVEAENVNISNLVFDCNSTGTNYWMKNAITLFGNSITVKDCAFTGKAANNSYVSNGIVIFPKTEGAASYDISENTFTGFNQEVGSGSDYWTSTALILCDNTSITKKDASLATQIPALASWNESSLANAGNTFTNCFANYIHQSGNSYVYGVTNTAQGVADGINSVQKDKSGTIVATNVSNDDIIAAVNTLKPSLEGKFIVQSKEGSIVADPNLVSTGTVFVLSKGTDDTYVIKQQTKDPEVVFSSLKASDIEAGQPLSASILSGGSANVSGVFSWKNPATIVDKGTKKAYDVIFTPTDLVTYNVVESTFTFDEIKQYYTVQTGKCANGHLEIANANASNKYEVGSKLTVKPVADAHYAFDKYLNVSGFTGNTYTVSDNTTLTAQFKPIMRTVTISITGDGTVNVNGESKTGTFEVQEGSVLTIQAAPADGQLLSSLTAGGSAINNNTVTVDKDLTITATFTAKPADKYVVKVDAVPNGKIYLYDAQGNAIASGSSFDRGTTISVVAVPDLGYKLKDNSLKYNTSTISDNKITVAEADVAITAEFEKQSFTVTTSAENGKVTLKKEGSEEVKPGVSVEYGTKLTAEATPNTGYKLLSLVVNGKEIPNKGSFIVSAKTTVTAVMAKLAEIKIDDTEQIFVYDREAKEFVVKTTPVGITGFTVKYDNNDDKPVNANNHKDKAYTVTITRAADDTYAEVNKTITDGLIIKAAQMKGVAIPTLDEGNNLVSIAESKGTYTLGDVNPTTHIGKVTFTPNDGNYAVITFSAAGTKATKCDYKPAPTAQLYSTKSFTRASNSSLNITVNGGNGSVKVLNGGVETTDLYVGQTVTLQAVPANTEYAANATWKNGSTTVTANTYEIELKNAENKVTVAFSKKDTPKPQLVIPSDMVYNGTPFGGKAISVADSPIKDWVLSFDGGTPTDAGTYKIYASRQADENYLAVVNEEVGYFTIAPAEADANDPVATDILQGQALAQSAITGAANVDGAFEWVNPNKVLNENAKGEAVRFVPTSKNYSVKTGLKADVTVTKTGVTIRTLNLTITGEGHGTVSMTLDGSPVDAGATVTKGQKLEVTATANTGYEASVQINGSARTTYTIGESGNVEVKVAFTEKSTTPTPNPEPGDDVTNVTGVSLDVTSKTLAVGESFALKATVKPADADNKKVSWSSSDATIASVDKDGNVKALKAGTCKITATTEDGDYTATCDVTVTTATGIDEILTVNRIYTDYRQIIIEPTTMLEVLISDLNGRIIYNGRTAEKISVSVSGGMYIVRLIDGKRVAATKVIVK